MDLSKKRKLDDNGLTDSVDPTGTHMLTPQDARKILEPFTPDQLLDILQHAVVAHPDVLAAVRSLADRDVTQRKLFIRGLGWETTSDSLRAVFTAFGELDEAVVILDKGTQKSKGFGFVTFKHIDGAVAALKEPSKKIDGRVAVAVLASAGLSDGGQKGGNAAGGYNGGGSLDTGMRKIYVGNVPYDMPAERLLSVFSSYGEIEEGPLGFDKATGKSKGFALFVYKTVEAANAALMEGVKVVDGRQLICKLASEGKKGKPGMGGDQMGMQQQQQQPGGPMGGQMGGPGGYPSGPGGPVGGYSSYGGYSNPMNPPVGGQGPGGYGGNAGYGAGGGGYGSGGGGAPYGGPNSGGYGGGGYGSGMGGAAGGGGGMSGGMGRGGYGMGPTSGGMPAGGGYSDGGHYGGYPSQPHQPTGTSPAPRIPPGGVGGYPSAPPPYY